MLRREPRPFSTLRSSSKLIAPVSTVKQRARVKGGKVEKAEEATIEHLRL